jgi:8-oxo-dGTP pyrophosphatase MutT (NUDIX family)
MHGDDDAKRAMFDRDEVVVKRRLRPKDAATLVLVRRDADAPRVLMGRRHGSMAFMANKTVFPGGRVDACDYRIGIGGEYKPHVAARLAGAGSVARALGMAAVRETFEETGVLVGERASKLPRTKSAWSRSSCTGFHRDSISSNSSHAQSRRPIALAASMRGSSWPMQALLRMPSTVRTRMNC